MHHLPKVKAKRSSSETLLERSAHKSNKNEVWINAEPIFPNLICDLLADGHSVKFFAPGDSMYPTIGDGDEITVAPIEAASIITGDIILYREKSGVTAHRVMRVIVHSDDCLQRPHQDSQDPSPSELLYFILRGDAAIVFDDPVYADQILGKVTFVERNGRRINPYSLISTICFTARRIAAHLKRRIRFQS